MVCVYSDPIGEFWFNVGHGEFFGSRRPSPSRPFRLNQSQSVRAQVTTNSTPFQVHRFCVQRSLSSLEKRILKKAVERGWSDGWMDGRRVTKEQRTRTYWPCKVHGLS